MKTLLLWLGVLGWALARCGVGRAAEPLQAQFQKALFEEEANQNLDGAIVAYQRLMADAEVEVRIAATAVFRLGECYRKLGRTNEAVAAYERVLREFPGQTNLVRLTRQNLVGLGHGGSPLIRAGEGSGEGRVGTPRVNLTDVVADLDGDEVKRLEGLERDNPELLQSYDSNGETPLHRAARKGYQKAVRHLAGKHVDLNKLTATGRRTAVYLAAAEAQWDTLELLLKLGGRADVATSSGDTALHRAVAGRSVRAVGLLLEKRPDLEAVTGAPLRTPLGLAVHGGSSQIIRMLVSAGAKIPQPKNVQPLLFSWLSSMEVSSAVFEYSPDVNESWNGVPILHAAVQGAAPLERVSMLLKRGANPNRTNAQQETALLVALNRNWDAESGRAEDVVLALVKGGADPNLGSAGMTPLVRAVLKGSVELATILLDAGADPNRAAPNGAPPLFAVSGDKMAIAELLLKRGARTDVNDRSNEGWGRGQGVLDVALSRRDGDYVKLLLDHGADPNRVNGAGYTAFEFLLSTRGWHSNPGGIGAPLPAPGRAYVPGASPASNGRVEATFEDLEELLLARGAQFPFVDRSSIRVCRKWGGPQIVVARRDAEGLNRLTLWEVIAACYAAVETPAPKLDVRRNRGLGSAAGIRDNSQQVLFPFSRLPVPNLGKPVWTNVVVHRPDALGKQWTAVAYSLESGEDVDCEKDPLLEWGDLIEIGETLPPRASAPGSPYATISMEMSQHPSAALSPAVLRKFETCLLKARVGLVRDGAAPVDEGSDGPRFQTLGQRPVMLRNLSTWLSNVGVTGAMDLTRVRVHRQPWRGQPGWTREFDVTRADLEAGDLWLRDGDRVEVPNRK